jgi:hypothetical protein
VTDEAQAREQLQTEWAQFTPSAKTQCNQENVELQTCLEMERDVKGGRWEDVKVALPVVGGLHGSRTERTRARKAPLADSK